MKLINQMKMEFLSLPANVAFARVTVAAFASQLDFTLADLEEIKVAVSEAVGNAIIHGYSGAPDKKVRLSATLSREAIEIVVEDDGRGIEDVQKALQPAYSTVPGRLGLGFVFMQSFMDYLKVNSAPGKGTSVVMCKRLGAKAASAAPEQ